MAYEDARMRAARLFREAVTRDPSLYKEFAPKFQTVGVDIGAGAPKGWTLPAMPDTTPSQFGDRNLPRARPDMPPGFTATDDPYLARQNMPPPASGLALDAPFMANPAVAAGAMQPASSLYPGFTQRDPAVGSSFSGLTRRRLDYGQGGPAVPGGIPSGGLQQPYGGAGPATPGAMPRQAPPLGGSPFTGSPGMASRLGDNSQLASGAFTGGQPPYGGAGPATPGGTGGLSPPYGGAGPAAPGGMPPASPLLAGKPFPSAPGMSSRFGDQSQLASGAFSGGPPPPMAGGPTPLQLDAAKDMVRQMASLPQVAPPKSLQPIETTPTSTMPNPLQRAPLNLAAGVGAPKLPLGSTNLPFAGIPPTPASVAQRTEILGPLPPGAGTGAPVRSAQAPLIAAPPASGTMPPVGTVTSQPLPPPSATSSIPNVQAGNLNDVLALSGVSPPPVTVGQTAPPGVTLPPGVTQQDVGRFGFGATNIDPSKAPVHRTGSTTGKYAGAALGALKGLPGGPVGVGVGAALGYQGGKRVGGLLGDRDFGLGARFTNPNYAQGVVANPPAIMDMGVPPITQPAQTPIRQADTGGIFGQGRRMVGGAAQKILSAVRSGAMPIEAAAKALGMPADHLRDSLSSMGSAGSGGMGMGGWSGSGGWGGGSSYTGGGYGGNAGGNINQGTGQRFGQR